MPCAKCHESFKKGDTVVRLVDMDEMVEDVDGDVFDETGLVGVRNYHFDCAWKDGNLRSELKSLRLTPRRLGLKPTKKVSD